MMLSPGAIGAVSEVLDAGDFYRESHAKIYRAALALYAKGEPVDAITLVDLLGERGELEPDRRAAADPRAGGARPGDRERGALRAHRPRDGDAARADPRRPGDRTPRLGAAGRDDRPARPGGAGAVRPLAGTRPGRLQPHRGASEGELRAHHRALRGRRRRHRRGVRLPRPRQAHVGVPAREPDHRRGAPVDGQVGARAVRRREHRRAHQRARSRCSRSRCRSPR